MKLSSLSVAGFLLLSAPVLAAIAPTKFETGDQAFKERQNPERAKAALKEYREAFQKDPKDAEAAWRVAMGTYFLGLRFTQDKDEKKNLFREGREAGLVAIKLNPNCAACHFWTAINMALYGQTVGAFKMYFTLNEIRDHLKTSIKLDPGYAHGGAYRLLGIIEQKLPGILGGSDKDARENFNKAIAVAPDEPLNYLFLATLLEKDLNKPQEALAMAKKGLELPEPAPDRLESREAREQLKKFVAKR